MSTHIQLASLVVGLLTVVFSAAAAVFSFLIWRSQSVDSRNEREAAIRERFEDTAFRVDLRDADTDVVEYRIMASSPRVQENTGRLAMFRKLLSGRLQGSTMVLLTFQKVFEISGGTIGKHRYELPNGIEELSAASISGIGSIEAVDKSTARILFDTVDMDEIENRMNLLCQVLQNIESDGND